VEAERTCAPTGRRWIAGIGIVHLSGKKQQSFYGDKGSVISLNQKRAVKIIE
jgi:hypothetical protein